jgi:hypothetical protein
VQGDDDVLHGQPDPSSVRGDVYISFPDEPLHTGAVPISLNEMYWFQLDVAPKIFCSWKEWKKKLISDLKKVNSRFVNTNTGKCRAHEGFLRLTYNQSDGSERFHAASVLIYFLNQ